MSDNTHHGLILDCLRTYGALGKDGISRKTGLDVNQCSRALPILARQGMVELTGRKVNSDSGRPEREWRLG